MPATMLLTRMLSVAVNKYYRQGETIGQPMKKNRKQTSGGGEPAEVPADFAAIVAAFDSGQQVQVGKMFSSNSVLNVNGKIFAMLVRGKLVVKLPKQRVDELIDIGLGERFNPGHGRLMKEWVAIRPERGKWADLAKEAYRFVKSAK
jgi:hypothetical protein